MNSKIIPHNSKEMYTWFQSRFTHRFELKSRNFTHKFQFINAKFWRLNSFDIWHFQFLLIFSTFESEGFVLKIQTFWRKKEIWTFSGILFLDFCSSESRHIDRKINNARKLFFYTFQTFLKKKIEWIQYFEKSSLQSLTNIFLLLATLSGSLNIKFTQNSLIVFLLICFSKYLKRYEKWILSINISVIWH